MKHIAVIGGGIAGLIFAKSLPPDRYQCHIFEKKAEFGELGAAISVFPNALRVCRKLGMLDDILSSAGELTKIYLKTPSGSNLAKSEPKYDLPAMCMHRADLHRVLMNHSTAELYEGYELETAQEIQEGKIKVNFSNNESRTFDAVVGAEGIHSVLRQQIIADGSPIFRGYNIWRGVCKSNFQVGYGSETFGRGQRVGIVPIKEGVFGWWATLNEDFMAGDEPEGARAKLLRLFGHWHDPIPELLKNTEVILKNSLSDRTATRGWSSGNMVLIGDAAHPTTPNLGQGGCMAMEGAYTLAKCIEKYGLSQEAYQRYETLHFPRAKSIIHTSLKIGEMGQWSNPLLCGLRNTIFKLMPSKLNLKMVDGFFNYDATKLDF